MLWPAIPMHLGPLHPIETALTIALAFGPFLLLGVVVVIRRRQDAREDAAATDGSQPEAQPAQPAQRER